MWQIEYSPDAYSDTGSRFLYLPKIAKVRFRPPPIAEISRLHKNWIRRLPEQATVDEFEAAILGRPALEALDLLTAFARLQALSRECTEAASLTSFKTCTGMEGLADKTISFDAVMPVPAVTTSLGGIKPVTAPRATVHAGW